MTGISQKMADCLTGTSFECGTGVVRAGVG
jgi:hypothetical protein